MTIFIIIYIVVTSLLLGFYWFNCLKSYSFSYLLPSFIGDVIGVAIAGIAASAVVKVLFHL